MSLGNIAFSSNKEAYGIDSQALQLLKHKKTFVNSPPKIGQHDGKFKLARGGHGNPLGKYP